MDTTLTLEDAAGSNDKLGALQQYLSQNARRSPQPTGASQTQPQGVNDKMQQLLMSRIHTPEQMQQLDQTRQSSLEQYQRSLMAPPEGNFSPTEQGAYTWIKNMGRGNPFGAVTAGIAAGGDRLRTDQEGKQRGIVAASKVGYDDAVSQEKLDTGELAALKSMSGGRNSKFIQFKDDKGNLYIMNNGTGEKQVIPASQTPLWSKAYLAGFNKAVESRNEDPEAFATEFANRTTQASPVGVAPVGTQQTPSEPIPGKVPSPNPSTLPDWPEINDKVAKENPSRVAEAKRIRAGEGVTEPDRTVLKPKNLRTTSQDEGYGKKEGEGLFTERENMAALHGSNTKLLSQLNMLEHLYKNPDIPEGELAPQIQSMRSGLKSLGIDTAEGVGLGDMARSISTGMALAMKNADGHNLLPGSMSNYEDQLLQKMAPTLSLTQNGRLGMIAFMKEIAASNIRMAQEANRMAEKNSNKLPDTWNARKERIMLEEMARLKDKSKGIIAQYGSR